jgi:GNAT superfamily N-acetyltransferase
MDYNNLLQNSNLFNFCQRPAYALDGDIWFIQYPYGYLNATYVHNFWYIKYVFIYDEYRNKGYGKSLLSDFIRNKFKVIMKVLHLNAFNCYRKCIDTHQITLYHPKYQFSMKTGKFYLTDNTLMEPYFCEFTDIKITKDTIIKEDIFKMPLAPFIALKKL